MRQWPRIHSAVLAGAGLGDGQAGDRVDGDGPTISGWPAGADPVVAQRLGRMGEGQPGGVTVTALSARRSLAVAGAVALPGQDRDPRFQGRLLSWACRPGWFFFTMKM